MKAIIYEERERERERELSIRDRQKTKQYIHKKMKTPNNYNGGENDAYVVTLSLSLHSLTIMLTVLLETWGILTSP